MTKQQEAAMRQALEGLEKWRWGKDPRGADEYIAALSRALEQPAQQVLEHAPCAGMNCGITRTDQTHSAECQAEHAAAIAGGTFVKTEQPAIPQSMKQALIVEAVIQSEGHPSKDARFFAKSVYEYLMAEPEQLAIPQNWKLVPVEPTQEQLRAATEYSSKKGLPNGLGYYKAMLNAAPQSMTPLTDEQILRLVPGLQDCLCDPYDYNNSGDDYASIPKDMIRLARAIEAAHGITGEKK